jgi:hypothetical protein
MQDISALIARVDDFLSDHNAGSRRPMNLAMFLYAAEHVARAVRVLRQPGAHLLSIGVGGSGRASLARLAASIAGVEAQQIEVTKSYGLLEWKEDLKKLTRMYVPGNSVLVICCKILFCITVQALFSLPRAQEPDHPLKPTDVERQGTLGWHAAGLEPRASGRCSSLATPRSSWKPLWRISTRF